MFIEMLSTRDGKERGCRLCPPVLERLQQKHKDFREKAKGFFGEPTLGRVLTLSYVLHGKHQQIHQGFSLFFGLEKNNHFLSLLHLVAEGIRCLFQLWWASASRAVNITSSRNSTASAGCLFIPGAVPASVSPACDKRRGGKVPSYEPLRWFRLQVQTALHHGSKALPLLSRINMSKDFYII